MNNKVLRMMKIRNIYYIAAVAAMGLTACSNELTGQREDEYYQMSFGVGTQELVAKAGVDNMDEGYRAWDAEKDPVSMGVTGFTNIVDATDENANVMDGIENLDVVYGTDAENASTYQKWTYSPLKYWAEYSWAKTFDFFAYMPHKANGETDKNATLTRDVNESNQPVYTLSVKNDQPVAFGKEENILLCHEPNHQDQIGNIIQFKMDQTLAGFALQFKLDNRMGELRDFRVKKVEIYGNVPQGGTVSRSYTLVNANGKVWDAGDITWTADGAATPIAEDNSIEIPYKNNGTEATAKYYADPVTPTENMTDGKPGTLRVTKDAAVQWGDYFFVLPDKDKFAPTIRVTYDVTLTYDGNKSDYLIGTEDSYTKGEIDDTEVLTRKDVVSTIVFSKDYFTSYGKTPETGSLNTILINISPSFLYVLADEDQTNKGMTITTK